MSKTTNALLFAADYRHTLETLVVPALKRGAVVITDRINLTMRVYQNTAEAEALAKMNDKIVTPDLIFIMTTPYDVFVKRRDSRDASLNNARDYIEKDVHDGYVERYVTYADTHPATCAVIDCLGEQSEVIKEVISTFTNRTRD
jgi:dTMP kinase